MSGKARRIPRQQEIEQPQSQATGLAKKLLDLHLKEVELEQANSSVFEEWRRIQADKDGLIARVKDEARKLSITGETTVVFDDPRLTVFVTGRRPSVKYDYKTAVKIWGLPKTLGLITQEIDSKEVERAVSKGILSESEAQQARAHVEDPTPAVSVKFA